MQNKNIKNEQSTKTPEANPSKRRKLVASLLLGLGIVIGAHNVAGKVNDEQRFPDGYRNIPQPEIYMKASNSVEPGATMAEPEPPAVLKGPYVEASHSVIAPNSVGQSQEK